MFPNTTKLSLVLLSIVSLYKTGCSALPTTNLTERSEESISLHRRFTGPSGAQTMYLYHGTCLAFLGSIRQNGPALSNTIGDFTYRGQPLLLFFRGSYSIQIEGGFFMTNTWDNAARYVRGFMRGFCNNQNPPGMIVIGAWLPIDLRSTSEVLYRV